MGQVNFSDYDKQNAKRVLASSRVRNLLAKGTRGYGFLLQHNNNTGSIEIGKQADLIILDRERLTIPNYKVSDTKVQLTLLGGKEIYRSENF